MTEFDFDELDKAVNSLMQKTPQSNGASNEPQTTSAVQTNTSSTYSSTQNATGAVSVNRSEDKPINPRPVQAANRVEKKSIASNRRGAFMDVVRPSSANNSNKTMSTSSKPVSRIGTEITPSYNPSIQDNKQDADADNHVETLPATDAVKSRSADDRELATTLSASVKQETTSLTAKPSDESINSNMTSESKLVESPTPAYPTKANESLFIPDAKVEKRPLGSQASTNDDSNYSAQSSEVTSNTQLPYELSSDIMAIESEKEVTKLEPAAPQPSLPADNRPPVVRSQSSAVQQNINSTAVNSTSASGVQDTESVEESPAIYDPAYYQQETKASNKSKSGWWAVIAIIGLIVLGGAGGVLYYLFSTNSF